MIQSLSDIMSTLQGYLDEQFIQLEELQDNASPDFVEEVVTSYYSDSARLIQNIDQALWVHSYLINNYGRLIVSVHIVDYIYSLQGKTPYWLREAWQLHAPVQRK